MEMQIPLRDRNICIVMFERNVKKLLNREAKTRHREETVMVHGKFDTETEYNGKDIGDTVMI